MTSEEYAALAAAQAMYKALGAVVSTKDGASLRAKADAELRQLWLDKRIFGKVPLTIGGHIVGMLTAKQAQPRRRRAVYVEDAGALIEAERDGIEDFVLEHIDEFAEWVVEQGVASPAGVSVSEWDEPGGWGGTTITGCKPDEVLPLLKGQLPEAVYMAIEGEVE